MGRIRIKIKIKIKSRRGAEGNREGVPQNFRKKRLQRPGRSLKHLVRSRIWWNWQTRYFEVVVPKGVQVQVLLSAPTLLRETRGLGILAQILHRIPPFQGFRR